MKTKNKLKKIIDNNLSCNLNYDKLSDKINFDQYLSVEKNKSKRILKPILICLIITIVITLGCSLLFIPSTKYIRNDIMIYFSDKEFVDNFDYIFIAKINKEVKTKDYVNTGTPVPYTFYSYHIIKKIKGEDIDNNNFIVFCGGTNFFNKEELLMSNNEKIELNEVYLIFANKKTANSNNDRLGENDLMLYNNDQKIKLNNYDITRTLENQDEEIINIVTRYKNIINKTIGNNVINFENYDTINESTYIWIIQIIDKIPRSNSGNGEYSSIVSESYYIEIVANLQSKPLTKKYNKLYCMGVNYWQDIINADKYITPPKLNEVYLLIANETNDYDNSRITEETIVIIDDSQLIHLADYNLNANYTKQSEEILEIIDKYKSKL